MAAIKRHILGGENNLNAKTQERRDGAVGMWVPRRAGAIGKASHKLAESVYCRAIAPAG